MHCFGFLNEQNLAQEAACYGDAGERPQLVRRMACLLRAPLDLGSNLRTGWTQRKDAVGFPPVPLATGAP